MKKTGAPPWDAVPRVWSALRRGSVLGYVVVDHVIGKHDFITYAVGISSGGVVRGVEILRYRESHGGDVRNERWRRQFVGRGREKPLRFGIDIKNIAGATLSCRHVTEGVRRVLALSEDWDGWTDGGSGAFGAPGGWCRGRGTGRLGAAPVAGLCGGWP